MLLSRRPVAVARAVLCSERADEDAPPGGVVCAARVWGVGKGGTIKLGLGRVRR